MYMEIMLSYSYEKRYVNDAPTVATPINDVTVEEDAADTVLDLSGTFSDPDGDSLTLTVVDNDNPSLPWCESRSYYQIIPNP